MMEINELHLNEICKFGKGIEVCVYLVVDEDGFKCAKNNTYLKKQIDMRKNKMVAKGDNCDGYGKNSDFWTDITIVLDRSGSMEGIKDDTIGGYNQFIEDQKKQKGKTTITLVQFDDKYELLYESIDVQKVKPLNNSTFVPRGLTALYDAINRTIHMTKDRINNGKKPDLILFVILTDGYENHSVEITNGEVIKNLIKQYENWNFIYLGANQDAIAKGNEMGIKRGRTMTFAHTEEGTTRAFTTLSKGTNKYRGGGMTGLSVSNIDFIDDEDREEQGKEGA